MQEELDQLRRENIHLLFLTDPDYPRRLLPLPNAPALLFYKGVADLNSARIIAIAGTRSPTKYGITVTAQLVSELACPGLLILSGLAYGIDAVAHRTALDCHVPTIGVLGHGFDYVYPAPHRGLFHDMHRRGGLVTSFLHETKPDQYTFPARNQLVAGLCDALVVIETSNKGGSLSAAAAARKFNKKVFALPGRITDDKSRGCLRLIQAGRALPLISADQLQAAIGWDWATGHLSHQPALPFTSAKNSNPAPITLSQYPPSPTQPTPPPNPGNTSHPLERQLIDLLTQQQPRSFDDLLDVTHEPIPALSLALFNLETRGIIRPIPGRRYHLVTQANTHSRHADNQAG